MIHPKMATYADMPANEIQLVLTAPGEAPDARWQQDCRQLYGQIRRALEAGEVQPLTRAAEAGDRAGALELFHHLVMTGISLGGFKAAFELAKLWLEHRNNCEVTLLFPDGAQLKVSQVSHEEAVRLWEEHSARFGKKRVE